MCNFETVAIAFWGFKPETKPLPLHEALKSFQNPGVQAKGCNRPRSTLQLERTRELGRALECADVQPCPKMGLGQSLTTWTAPTSSLECGSVVVRNRLSWLWAHSNWGGEVYPWLKLILLEHKEIQKAFSAFLENVRHFFLFGCVHCVKQGEEKGKAAKNKHVIWFKKKKNRVCCYQSLLGASKWRTCRIYNGIERPGNSN